MVSLSNHGGDGAVQPACYSRLRTALEAGTSPLLA